MTRKATMRNRRLTISALALIAMAGCGVEGTLTPEMLELAGTWPVQTWVVTDSTTGAISVDLFNQRATTPGEVDLTAATTFYIYDNGDLLQTLFYADTLDTATSLISLEVDPEYEVDNFCINAAGDEDFCQNAGAGDLIFDEGTSDEFAITFAQSGDDLTLSGNLDGGFDFGAGTEPATFVITLERIIFVDDRGPLVE